MPGPVLSQTLYEDLCAERDKLKIALEWATSVSAGHQLQHQKFKDLYYKLRESAGAVVEYIDKYHVHPTSLLDALKAALDIKEVV